MHLFFSLYENFPIMKIFFPMILSYAKLGPFCNRLLCQNPVLLTRAWAAIRMSPVIAVVLNCNCSTSVLLAAFLFGGGGWQILVVACSSRKRRGCCIVFAVPVFMNASLQVYLQCTCILQLLPVCVMHVPWNVHTFLVSSTACCALNLWLCSHWYHIQSLRFVLWFSYSTDWAAGARGSILFCCSINCWT